MPTTRGHIGKLGSEYVIRFTKPGYDALTAPPEGFLFRDDAPQVRALAEGELLNAPAGQSTIPLPKSFVGLPLIFVARYVGADCAVGPGNGFEVWLYRGTNYFVIDNQSSAGANYRYTVFDNEIT